MKKINLLYLFLLLSVFISGFIIPKQKADDWTQLFNGKDLNGWDTYIGPLFDSSGNKLNDIPYGLNKDPNHVFSVVKQDGENVIRISGQNFGGISTKKEFENYHLQLMFKWGLLKWPPKKNKKRDSGLLYHAVGAHGADFGFWMRSQEFQIEEGNCGDYWGVAGGIQDIKTIKKSDSEYVYNAAGKWNTFSATSKTGRHCIKQTDAEKPSGEWNTLDLYVHGDTSVHVINGKLMMVLYHSRQLDNGKELPLTKGAIQIQSEGAEIFYKQIKIKPLGEIPSQFFSE
jgi:3-keto-disaccharide hydrolase